MNALKAPTINARGIPGFLLWAREGNPALYRALVRQFPEVAAFDEAGDVSKGMAGLFDTFSDIGSSLASAAGRIGNFVKVNALPIATAALPVLVAKKQADVANAQVKLAQAQQSPMQTAYTTDANGNVIAVPVQPRGVSTGVSASSLLMIGGAGVAALILFMLLKRK
jgi:hypothetical protein